MYGDFKRQSDEIAHEKTWTYLRKENIKRETKFLQIAVQNNAIRTNYVKAKTDYKRHNRKSGLSR